MHHHHHAHTLSHPTPHPFDPRVKKENDEPFTMPQKARVPIAHHRFLLKPKEQAEMELPINPVNNTGRRPRRSENLPHNMAVQN